MGVVIYGLTLSVFLAFGFMNVIEFEFIVVICIFSAVWKLKSKCTLKNIGLYRDDGLGVIQQTSGTHIERLKKECDKNIQRHWLQDNH